MAENRLSQIPLGYPQDSVEIRKADRKDIPAILDLYEHARQAMAAAGNASQWNNGYPGMSEIEADLAKGALYITSDRQAVMAFLSGEDPTYARIDGAWRCQRPYRTIHRIASARKGYGKMLFRYAKTCTDHIRIDTHPDNKAMRYLLKKEGFSYDGIIESVNGPRMAFTWTAQER